MNSGWVVSPHRRTITPHSAGIEISLSALPGPSPRASGLVASPSWTTGRGTLVEKGWGTEIRLSAAALPGDGPFRLVVIGADGSRQLTATWGATPGGTATVTGASSFDATEIAEVRVLDASGAVLEGATAG